MDVKVLPTQCDVVVIGGGFAGLCSAVESALAGAKVVVVEKMQALGGNSLISDGGIAAPGTPEQQAVGIVDSVDIMYEDMMRSGEGLNDPQLTRLICEQALEAYQWTKDYLQVEYLPRVDIFGGHQVPRCYTPTSISGRQLINQLQLKLQELGVPIYLGTVVETLLTDEQGSVIGVRVNSNYKFRQAVEPVYHDIMVDKGVVVAAGGYAADINYRQQGNPQLDATIQTTNKLSADSALLQECIRNGAATTNLDKIQCIPWTTIDEPGYSKGGLFGDYIVSSAGILIDPLTGKRFVDEQSNRKQVTDAIFGLGHWVLGIADQQSVNQAGWDLTSVLNKGIVHAFSRIEELAQYYQIPANKLKETMEYYNQCIRSGNDLQFHKSIDQWVQPLDHPPYYTMRIYPKTHYTLGGLVTNLAGQVIHQDGHLITGLYAVGEITGMTHGANRLGSCSVTECVVMGRVVGQAIGTNLCAK